MRLKPVVCSLGSDGVRSEHVRAKNLAIARMIAELRGCEFVGEYERVAGTACRPYFVPHDTLVGVEVARDLHIRSHLDLYGGVVPLEFVATKAIAHPVLGPGAPHPAGWSERFSRAVRGAVLPGYTAFSLLEARRAGELLVGQGCVRLKLPRAAGGDGQYVVRTRDELAATLAGLDRAQLARGGVVLERNLHDATTYSVGQVRIGGLVGSYHGVQRTTVGNDGATCYGGSDLVVVRGGYEELLSLDLSDAVRRAIVQAAVFDRAVKHYPHVLVSRRNYDVGQGYDCRGEFRSGVFEAGWRIGGASGPEIAALQIFKRDPTAHVVQASSFERYGEGITVPEGCLVHFEGTDPERGPMQMYTAVTGCLSRLAPVRSALALVS